MSRELIPIEPINVAGNLVVDVEVSDLAVEHLGKSREAIALMVANHFPGFVGDPIEEIRNTHRHEKFFQGTIPHRDGSIRINFKIEVRHNIMVVVDAYVAPIEE